MVQCLPTKREALSLNSNTGGKKSHTHTHKMQKYKKAHLLLIVLHQINLYYKMSTRID
jgi:hypothetical protein